ncbi:uncharacterized protein LOC117650679 [Thrips palmi]|uniref:Uncharacterized protein LOC117650679 n=1 Tax=Thrips palmi TaxID=161013 RepID=A0A6P8ZXK2_THRPL|nr:uncharacterized protein LOC117650679 [Thrips palmi]XP_034250148.1 uncharacterized protein LOC117650679 [Thrips palmi]XP_034250149.1 uncharacterized protein LOC117650679 [Thrips palmi]
MRILQHVCSVMIALWAIPVAPLRTLPHVAAVPAVAVHRVRHSDTWHSLSKRSAAWGSPSSTSSLVASARGQEVVAAEGGTTTPAAAAAAEEATTTEEPYDAGGDEGGDFGSDILNTLLEVVGALLSFFTDPPGAIQKMVEEAQKLTGAARSLMGTGPAGARAAQGMLEEAKRILESAKGLVEAGGKVATKARDVAESLSRPWQG